MGIAVGEMICVVDQIDRERETHWVSPVFRAQIVEGEPSNQEPEALSEIGWFDLRDLPGPLTSSTRRAIGADLRARRIPAWLFGEALGARRTVGRQPG